MFIIEILKSIIYGIVEGITEWLPISSTGHLILIQDFIKYKNENPAFMEMFNVVIQLGAILAVVVIYFDKLNPFKPGKTARQIQLTWQLWAKVVVAALPAAIIGFFLDDWFEAHFYNLVSVAIMLIIYGVAFIYLEKREQVEPTVTELSRLPYQTALYISLVPLSGNQPIRCDHCRWSLEWCQPTSCDRVYFLLGDSNHVWCKWAENLEIYHQGQFFRL